MYFSVSVTGDLNLQLRPDVGPAVLCGELQQLGGVQETGAHHGLPDPPLSLPHPHRPEV